VNSLVDKPVGVSLSVTPTVIDDENILLNVKVARSFVQLPAQGVTGAAVSTSRNVVTASITAKYGETIVLSGLTERELMRGDSGVPVLKDIPGIQYMFDRTSKVDFFRTVMVLITPRKPVADSTAIDGINEEKNQRKTRGISPAKKYQFHWRAEEYEKILNKYAPNLDAVIETLETNQLYKGFKGTDLVDSNWAAKSRKEKLLIDLERLFWR
jgi:type II secretory pathway component GspD/PulD (secretin)